MHVHSGPMAAADPQTVVGQASFLQGNCMHGSTCDDLARQAKYMLPTGYSPAKGRLCLFAYHTTCAMHSAPLGVACPLRAVPKTSFTTTQFVHSQASLLAPAIHVKQRMCIPGTAASLLLLATQTATRRTEEQAKKFPRRRKTLQAGTNSHRSPPALHDPCLLHGATPPALIYLPPWRQCLRPSGPYRSAQALSR